MEHVQPSRDERPSSSWQLSPVLIGRLKFLLFTLSFLQVVEHNERQETSSKLIKISQGIREDNRNSFKTLTVVLVTEQEKAFILAYHHYGENLTGTDRLTGKQAYTVYRFSKRSQLLRITRAYTSTKRFQTWMFDI